MCRCSCGECGAPAYIAWSGKRQWMELLNVGRRGREKYKKLEQGLQHMRPKVSLANFKPLIFFSRSYLPSRCMTSLCHVCARLLHAKTRWACIFNEL